MNPSSRIVSIVGIGMVFIVVVFPTVMALYSFSGGAIEGAVHSVASLPIVVRTIAWAVGIAIMATVIGWPTGIRIASLQANSRFAIYALLVVTLVIPAYAIFYVWWQVWPSGSALHGFVVTNGLLGIATKVCLALALTAWSWPIPALLSAAYSRSDNSLSVLSKLDGSSRLNRWAVRVRSDSKGILLALFLVAAFIAANTTCFDLAQVVTIGNELRSVVASGGSALSSPMLSFVGVLIAVLAAFATIRIVPSKHTVTRIQDSSPVPVITLWLLVSGLPLIIAIAVTGGALTELWKLYNGDIWLSVAIASTVAAFAVVLILTSTLMHLSNNSTTRATASVLDFIWIVAAFLPSSIVSSALATAWHSTGFDFVYRTPAILVIAHFIKVGFVASLAGRWVATCKNTRTLCAVDGLSSPWLLLLASLRRIIIASVLVVGIAFAVSLGEIALTNQLSPPSTNQPIAVALLNAMHYQRPQIVTSALFVIIAVACLCGFLVLVVNKKYASVLILAVFVSCTSQEQEPIASAMLIGGVGQSDGRFTTPRAIATNDEIIIVIDKSGRLQRFKHDGTFLSTWDLHLSGTGFPTGVSIDDSGLIWIADTHQQRILVLDQNGTEVNAFGEYGTGDGQFLYPTDVAFGDDGEVYVSEYGGNDRISVFTRAGEFRYSFGHFGSGDEDFLRPQSIAISPSTGNLFISDAGNHRIVERTKRGAVVQIIGTAGRGQGQLLYPYGIVFDSPTTFLVAEFGNNRLQRFTVDGEALETYGGAGDVVGLFKTPWAVETGQGGIIVADTGNNRLQRLPDMMVY
jgi:sugar lactone lactonase YvrE